MTDDEIALWLITKGTMEDKPIMALAADRILTLRAERDRLREALDETAQILSQCTFEIIRVHGQYIDRREAVSRARAALKGETP